MASPEPPSSNETLPVLPALRPDFECHHGETVSAAVHHARVTADDPACRGCEHAQPQPSDSLVFDAGNVRGRYLNRINRAQIRAWCHSLATLLWERAEEGRRPTVIAGYDERPSSPDLAVGFDALRLGGCDVIEIGRTLRPMMDFGVRRAGADAGVFVTGGGRPAGWTGLDLVGRGGRPWSTPGNAAAILERSGSGRASRTSGSSQVGSVDRHYVEDLKDVCHGLRPLTVVALTPTHRGVDVLSEIATLCPGRILIQRVGERAGVEFAEEIQAMRYDGLPAFDVAVRIALDGCRLSLLDESGSKVEAAAVARGLVELHSGTSFAGYADDLTDEAVDKACGSSWTVTNDVIAGVDRGGFRRRDGFWLFAQVLKRLAVSDAPASQVFSEVRGR